MPTAIHPLIRIYLAPGESGWAWDLGGGLVKIANIPTRGPFNLEDVVRVTRSRTGLPSIGELVSRKYANKSFVEYSTTRQFKRICKALKKAGCAVEGLISPSANRSGWIAVASPARVYPPGIAESRSPTIHELSAIALAVIRKRSTVNGLHPRGIPRPWRSSIEASRFSSALSNDVAIVASRRFW